MPRRLSMLVAVMGISAAVALVAWSQRRGTPHRAGISAAADVGVLKLESSEPSVDPTAAVATILDVRAQFGSVLSDSEFLDVAKADGKQTELAGDPQSFDAFLRAEAGVVLPPAATEDLDSGQFEGGESPPADELAQSLRETATWLVLRVEQTRQRGAMSPQTRAQQARFVGLAAMLRAEADALSVVERTDR